MSTSIAGVGDQRVAGASTVRILSVHQQGQVLGTDGRRMSHHIPQRAAPGVGQALVSGGLAGGLISAAPIRIPPRGGPESPIRARQPQVAAPTNDQNGQNGQLPQNGQNGQAGLAGQNNNQNDQNGQNGAANPGWASLTSMPSELPSGLQGFEKHEMLGQGAYALVLRVTDPSQATNGAGKSYALKVIEKRPLAIRNMLPQLYRESRVHRYIASESEHCVRAQEVFEDTTHLYLLLEFCPRGSLLQVVCGQRVAEPIAAGYIKQVAKGLQFLHDKGVIHRDVKLDNLLVAEDGSVKICDFGWCALVSEEPNNLCGTPDFAAPEVLRGEKQTTKVDSWALGVCLVQLLIGRSPRGPEIPAEASAEARSFLSGLFAPGVANRFTMAQALAHPFLPQDQEAASTQAYENTANPNDAVDATLAVVSAAPEDCNVDQQDAGLGGAQDVLESITRLLERSRLLLEEATLQLEQTKTAAHVGTPTRSGGFVADPEVPGPLLVPGVVTSLRDPPLTPSTATPFTSRSPTPQGPVSPPGAIPRPPREGELGAPLVPGPPLVPGAPMPQLAALQRWAQPKLQAERQGGPMRPPQRIGV